MKIFAIGDLHLSFSMDKPMDVFGEKWRGHAEKIAASWRGQVGPGDAVLLPGDISWAMRLREAEADFAWLRELPGRKVMIRGNHDYWWDTLKKMKEAFGDGFEFVQNNCVRCGCAAVAGSRLWNYPFVKWPHPSGENAALAARGESAKKTADRGVDDDKVRASELARLQNSLGALPPDAPLKICLAHFPPVSAVPEPNPLTEMIAASGVKICLYGHVHGLEVAPAAADCTISGVRYLLVAADYLDFAVRFVAEA